QYGMDIVGIDYKGAAESYTALLAGDVQLSSATPGHAVGDVTSGKLKALAISSAQRSKSLPNVPTAREVGFNGFYSSWQGLWGPAGMPPEAVQALYGSVSAAAATKEVRDGLEKLEATVLAEPPDALARRVERQIQEWRVVVK